MGQITVEKSIRDSVGLFDSAGSHRSDPSLYSEPYLVLQGNFRATIGVANTHQLLTCQLHSTLGTATAGTFVDPGPQAGRYRNVDVDFTEIGQECHLTLREIASSLADGSTASKEWRIHTVTNYATPECVEPPGGQIRLARKNAKEEEGEEEPQCVCPRFPLTVQVKSHVPGKVPLDLHLVVSYPVNVWIDTAMAVPFTKVGANWIPDVAGIVIGTVVPAVGPLRVVRFALTYGKEYAFNFSATGYDNFQTPVAVGSLYEG
jgi:hypothetical protein